jgi:hypothetical protein
MTVKQALAKAWSQRGQHRSIGSCTLVDDVDRVWHINSPWEIAQYLENGSVVTVRTHDDNAINIREINWAHDQLGGRYI